MEFTGQAFEEMQEQNIRVLQELREKEEANLKLMSEVRIIILFLTVFSKRAIKGIIFFLPAYQRRSDSETAEGGKRCHGQPDHSTKLAY